MTERVSARRATGWTVVNILVVLYALFPVLWILSLSLKPTSTVKDGKLIPAEITFENYKGIFSGDAFSSALINSIGIGLITTADRGGHRRHGGVRRGAACVPGQATARRCRAADRDVPADLVGDTDFQHVAQTSGCSTRGPA